MAKLKEVKGFLKRYAVILLMLAVVLTVSAGTLWAKYATDVTVTDELSLEVKAEQKYVINKLNLWNNLQHLTQTGSYTYYPETLKFVTGVEVYSYQWIASTQCENTAYSIRFGWDSTTKTMYIGPDDSNDSTSVVCAPADSSRLLHGTISATLRNKLTTIDCSNLDTSKVTNMSEMFSGLTSLTNLTLGPRFDTSKVTNMSNMFNDCSALKTITVASDFNTESVVSSTYMFADCTSLVGGAGTRFKNNKVDCTYAKIDKGEEGPGYFTGVSNELTGLSMNLASDIFAVGADPVQDGDTVDPVGDVTDVTEVTTEEPVVTEKSDVTETKLPSEESVSTDTSEPTEELPQVTEQTEETDALDNGNS